MANQQIVLADSHAENVRILKENFEGVGYQVYTAYDCDEALEKIKTVQPDLLLAEYILPDADGLQLVARLAEDPVTARTPVIFLSKKGDLETRLRGLKLGAKDYLVKPMHVKEVLARVKLVISRLERLETEMTESEAILSGKLDEVSVLDLIEHLSREKRTGVLKLRNGHHRDGQIFLRNGAIINAVTHSLKREDAVFEMLLWQKGKFSILFQQIEVPTEIYVSTLGLLLEGARRVAEWNELADQIPSLDTPLVVSDNFKQILSKRDITPELHKFISLFNGSTSVAQVIQASDYDTLSSIERIVKLYRQGFLEGAHAAVARPEVLEERVLAEDTGPAEEDQRPIEAPDEPAVLEKEEILHIVPAEAPVQIEHAAERSAVSSKGVLFVGSVQGGRKQVINTLTNGNFRVKTLKGYEGIALDRGAMVCDDGMIVEVFGMEPDSGLSALFEVVAQDLSGYIVILDGLNKDLFDYYTYLITSLKDNLTLPYSIAILNYNASNVEGLRKRLNLHPQDTLVSCDPVDRRGLQRLVLNLIGERTRAEMLEV